MSASDDDLAYERYQRNMYADLVATKQIFHDRDFKHNAHVLLMDVWDINLACHLIAANMTLESYEEFMRLDNHGDIYIAINSSIEKCRQLADSSVLANNISSFDTPAKWIKWAESKGYSVSHLTNTPTSASKPSKLPAPKQSVPNDPWPTDRALATTNEVMSLLRYRAKSSLYRLEGFPKQVSNNRYSVKDVEAWVAIHRPSKIKP